MAFENGLLTAWQQDTPTFGVWCKIPSLLSAEVVAAEGFDYACVDMQHGAISYEAAVAMLMAIRSRGVTPVTRVLSNDAGTIQRLLDAGSLGVIVPMINNAEEAERAVQACRFPPLGSRSYGPVLAQSVIGSGATTELDKVACIAMVETAEGLEKADEIAATPGVDALYVGPADLALALGLQPGSHAGELADAISAIRQACDRHGIAAGIQCANGETARRYREEGFSMITVGADSVFMALQARAELGIAREPVAAGTASAG